MPLQATAVHAARLVLDSPADLSTVAAFKGRNTQKRLAGIEEIRLILLG